MSPRLENPYMNRVMIRDPAEFVGRKVEIEKVFSRIGAARPQSVSIVGERRIGKSSLLYHLSRPEVYAKNLTDPSRYVFVLVDLHGLGDLNVSEFFDLLLDEISAAAGISRPQGISSGYFAMKQFLPELHRNGRKLVLLWDEFDSVTRNRKFGEEFFSFFRSMANRYDIAYVTTAVRELQEICHTESVAVSPFFNIFTNLYLRTFSPEEARELICGPSGRSEIPLDEHEPALLDVAGYFPFFLQLACCSLFDQLAEDGQKERAVERARLQFAEEARPHVLYLWHHLEPELREVVRVIARGGNPATRLSYAEDRLLRDGYLINTRNGLKLFSSLFCRWLDEFDRTSSWPGVAVTGHAVESRTTTPAQRYTVLRQLGQGGMSTVMLAHDNLLEQDVALKILNRELYTQPGILLRFKRETALARELHHPNICPVFDLVEEAGFYKIAMKYIDGITLKDRIRASQGLGIPEFVEVARQILRGLDAAHRILIHRDLKPHNIMLDRQGHVYILDFGLAHSPADEDPTLLGSVVGTPAYMSPEQIEGSRVDHRSDLYSLGVIFFEMATGECPFSADTVEELFEKHRTVSPPSPAKLRPDIPSEIESMILSLLTKSPAERPSSAHTLLTILDHSLTKRALSGQAGAL
jgi:tRNA A-37 threonylcarbamoyl transferase component Bud32